MELRSLRAKRATALPVGSAVGDTGPPPFMFYEKRLPYRNTFINDITTIQTNSTHLPRIASLLLPKESGGIDSSKFYAWYLR